VFNIISLVAEIGGLSSAVLKLAMILGIFINSRVHIETLVKENYFLKLSAHKKNNTD